MMASTSPKKSIPWFVRLTLLALAACASTPEIVDHSFGFNAALDIGGPMLRGDSLYVKWKIKSTGAVHEDTVDLRHRLPREISGQLVYFVIHRPKLNVFLISNEPRPPGIPAIGSRVYDHLKAIEIYPARSS